MQKTIHFFIFLFLSAQLLAQNLSISTNYTTMQGKSNEEIAPTVTLKNTGSMPIEVRWEKIRSNAPQGWESVVCDKQCYSTLIESRSIILAPGEVLSDFRVSFRPNGLEGIGSVELRIYETRNPKNSQTIMFSASAQQNNLSSIQGGHQSLSVFPNPAIDYISLQDAHQEVKFLEIYNVVGRKVIDFPVRSEGAKYDIGELPRGMYMVRLLDRNHNIIRTQRISKYNP